jgi:hypothetical protein
MCFSLGSVTSTLASKEELATGASIGRAGLSMPPLPPVVEPSLPPTGLNLEAATCEFPRSLCVCLFFLSLRSPLNAVFWFLSSYP